jgi:hypothetical protein
MNGEHATGETAEYLDEHRVAQRTHEVASNDSVAVFEPVDRTEVVDDDCLPVELDEENE